ncbi:hypothetical protein CERSUDRAFT_96405 [Gelatoporia subvermispora B]|uniref:Uncharacterized protein n=1 Tax=Ceriporiopsis subvermispora (strain B) TaxID=914234 RepID=M2RA06_CERS8|nr:hypothetical protein CERSUDRAFT_96405 [Gelatoporia subvermispora B]
MTQVRSPTLHFGRYAEQMSSDEAYVSGPHEPQCFPKPALLNFLFKQSRMRSRSDASRDGRPQSPIVNETEDSSPRTRAQESIRATCTSFGEAIESSSGIRSAELKIGLNEILAAAQAIVRDTETLPADQDNVNRVAARLDALLKLLMSSINVPGSGQRADVVQRWVLEAADVLKALVERVSSTGRALLWRTRTANFLCEDIITDCERLEYEGKIIQQMFDPAPSRNH